MTYHEYKHNGETLTEKVPYTFLCGLGLMEKVCFLQHEYEAMIPFPIFKTFVHIPYYFMQTS